jgi:ketosteroid isomerase-like protein
VSRENVEALMRAFEVAQDDPEAFYAIFDPDVEWDASHTGLPEFSETVRGVEVVRDFFHRWLQSFSEYEYEAAEVIDVGEHVVVILRHRIVARHSGIELQDQFAQIWTFREGKVVRYRGFPTKEEALAAIREPLGTDRPEPGLEPGG